MAKFKSLLYENGMFTMLRGHQVFTNPPLIAKKEHIDEGFRILDDCLYVLDEAMEDAPTSKKQ